MSKKTKNTVHINLTLAAAVAAGYDDPQACVGQVRIVNPFTGQVEFQNLYVHFERDDGTPRVSDKGNLRLNARPQH